jgi:hypothetical protein
MVAERLGPYKLSHARKSMLTELYLLYREA